MTMPRSATLGLVTSAVNLWDSARRRRRIRCAGKLRSV
ncbi:hypothetical protein GQ600_11934 [Phytophthora cactorum]|nr:hypothetical protein GQ600_11934 [Phytophthora cactorum]